MVKLRNACLLLVLSLYCCRKPYDPPAVSTLNSFLVVEGTINSGNDSTIIKLSKTVKLNDKVTTNPVLGATVVVENDQNNNWPLSDMNGKGSYSSPSLGLSSVQKYRLKITTSDGKQYASDFMAVKPTPPIDSVGYVLQDGAVQLYVNAHDPANSTHYYRWDYDETWMFHSRWPSAYVLDTVTNKIVARTPDQNVYFCYGNDKSSNIIINSTAKLTNDVVYQSPLTKIPLTSEKVESKYSILVRQYALTPEAYQFYQNLAKNTEQLGSIFDAQPSQLKGNIHSMTDPTEAVIGYLTVTNVQTKRIFIPTSDLTSEILTVYPYDCEQDTAAYFDSKGLNSVQGELVARPITHIPTSGLGSNLPPSAFLYSSSICVDCTLRGTKQKPPFWK